MEDKLVACCEESVQAHLHIKALFIRTKTPLKTYQAQYIPVFTKAPAMTNPVTAKNAIMGKMRTPAVRAWSPYRSILETHW